MVVAKFTVNNVEDAAEGSKTITMNAVYSGSDENKEFFKFTPNGHLSLGCVNPSANEQFVPNEEKFILFMSPEEYAAYQGTKVE